MKTINKNQAIKLTKIIYKMKEHSIPLEDVMIGLKGITLKTIDTELNKRLQAVRPIDTGYNDMSNPAYAKLQEGTRIVLDADGNP